MYGEQLPPRLHLSTTQPHSGVYGVSSLETRKANVYRSPSVPPYQINFFFTRSRLARQVSASGFINHSIGLSLTYTQTHRCTRAHVPSHSFVSVVSRDGQLSRTRLASTRVTPRDALSGAEQQVDLHTSPSNCALCRRPQGAGHVTKN